MMTLADGENVWWQVHSFRQNTQRDRQTGRQTDWQNGKLRLHCHTCWCMMIIINCNCAAVIGCYNYIGTCAHQPTYDVQCHANYVTLTLSFIHAYQQTAVVNKNYNVW